MFKKVLIGSVIGLLVLTAAGALALAGLKAHGPELVMERIHDQMVEQLALSSEQVEKLDALWDGLGARLPELRAEREEMRESARDLFLSEKVDEAAIMALADEHRALMEQRLPEMVQTILAFHAILTPEQRLRLVEELDRMHAKFAERGPCRDFGRQWHD